jgi:glycosyltransferase involved in cell wall biosynthesis
MKKFTVYTPVYNSAKYFSRVYESLIKQSFTDFEWIIINDGSKDNSSSVIQEYIQKCSFDINFIDLKENIGFNKSMNLAVKESKGELFLISHADDEFTSDALEIFNTLWENMDISLKERVQGIKCNCINQHGDFVGNPFPEDYWIADIFDLVYKYKINGEKWGFIRTDIFKEFPFPEDQKFTSEGVIWHRMYYKYPAVFVNKILRIYYVDDNPESLSVITKWDPKFAPGKRLLPLDFINYYFKRVNYNPKLIMYYFLMYWNFSFLSKITVHNALKDINNLSMRLLSLAFILPGYIISKRKL